MPSTGSVRPTIRPRAKPIAKPKAVAKDVRIDEALVTLKGQCDAYGNLTGSTLDIKRAWAKVIKTLSD